MRFPGFFFGGASFGRDRRSARPAAKARRRRNAAHRLAAESLEGRAVLAVVVPAPMVTGVADDHGVFLRTGARTNAAELTISGTVSSAVTAVEVFNGTTSLGTATPSGKTWSFTTTALGEGTYNFRARATNGTVTSPASPRAFVVTVDMTAPMAPTVNNVVDDKMPVVGTVPRNGTTNDRTLTLVGTAEPGSRVEVFADLDGSGSPAPLGIATLVGSTWRFTTTPLTPDGNYSFTAKATDKAGNTSAATVLPYVVTIDASETTPVISEIIDNVGNPPTDVAPIGLSNDTTLELKGTADVGSTVKVFDGKTLLAAVRADNSGMWKVTTRPLNNGQTYRFAAQAGDAAGNTSALSVAIPILIDTTPPWRPLITGVSDGSRSVVDRGVTNQTSLTISGRAEPGSTVTLHDGSVALSPVVAVDATGNWSLAVSGLGDGVHPFHATATDAAGNASVLPSVTFTVSIDTTVPAVPTIDSVTDAVFPGLGSLASGDATNDSRPLLTGTSEPGTAVKVYDGPPGPQNFLGLATLTGTTWTFRPAVPLSAGSHTLNVTATDPAGNESAAAAFTVIVDTTPATFDGFGDLPQDGVYGLGDEILIEIEFQEPVSVDGEPRIALNTDPPRYATYVGGSGTNTLVFKYEPQLGDMSTDLDLAAGAIDLNGGSIRDAAGNDVDPVLPTPGSPASLGAQTAIQVDARITVDPSAVLPAGLVGPTSPGPSLTAPLPPITIRFNAPLTRDLTIDAIKLFLEDRSMSTEGVTITKLADDTYSLTLPPATHQSLKGRYRLDIGGVGSGIESGGVPMDTVVSLYWQLV